MQKGSIFAWSTKKSSGFLGIHAFSLKLHFAVTRYIMYHNHRGDPIVSKSVGMSNLHNYMSVCYKAPRFLLFEGMATSHRRAEAGLKTDDLPD